MLSEKKISNKGNDEDYFGEMSKTFGNMYDSIASNKAFEPIQEQVNNLTKSSTEILGNTLNLNPDPFASPNPIPNQEFNPPVQQNIADVQTMLSQGPQLTPEGPQMIPQGSQVIEQINDIPSSISSPLSSPSDSSSKSIMDTFSGVFSSDSTETQRPDDELFKASDYSMLENIITILLLFLFLVLIGIYAMQYFYGIDIVAKIKNIFTNHPEIEIKVEQEPEKKDAIDNDVSQIMKKPQVFNISENNYIYGDAQAVCKAYGARLATYKEVEEAYNKGAEWCNYGWSEGQMALFPTQQKTFDELQKIEGHENDCGRPGINGGFIDNPKLRYGVNCYGYKPRINKIEKELMETSSIYPKTEKDIAMDKRVEYWKERLSEIIISPFNHEKWSKI